MPNINIDGQDFDYDTMPAEAKNQLASIQFVDAELQRLNAQAAVLQTARVAYMNALKLALANAGNTASMMNLVGDTLKLQ